MTKNLGLALVVAGVMLSAATGSRLSPPEATVVGAEGAAVLADTEAPAAETVAGPAERLSSWASDSGLPFLGGVVLIGVGAVLSRRAQAAEAAAPAASGGGASAEDFGTVLQDTLDAVRALAEQAQDRPASDDAWTALREGIESVQKGPLARLLASDNAVRLRFGLDGHASLYSPIAGGERKLNRAWSALVDRHHGETRASIEAAADHLAVAVTALEARLAA